MANFDLYFAGSGSKQGQDEIISTSCNKLLSYGINKSDIFKFLEYKKEHPEYTGKLFIDSGAHSISTGKLDIDKQVYLDEYIQFINDTGDQIDIYAELDDVPDGRPRDTFKNSWDTYLYMMEKVDLKYRDKVIPILHFGEDFDNLRMMLEYRHPDTGKPIPYIGLAPRFGNYAARYNWLDEAFKIIKQSSNPNVKTHAFGCTILKLLEQFPLTSADSATWAIAAAYGNLRIGDKSVVVSDRTTDKNTNVINKSIALQEEVEKHANKHGFSMQELSESATNRQIMAIREMKAWQDNYVCRYNNAVKNTLW